VNILEQILEQKSREVARLPAAAVTGPKLRAAMARRGDRRDFAQALRQPKIGPVALIAEVKKASPSAGVLRAEFDPVALARTYEAAGASCLSVLTDERFFQGALPSLRAIRQAVSLPLLRKDFIIDERQILESILAGADAILLIVGILDDGRLSRFHALALEAGLSVLVEVHDEAQLQRALRVVPGLLGINNRDLTTFRVDLATTERLAAVLHGQLRDSPHDSGGTPPAHEPPREIGRSLRLSRSPSPPTEHAGSSGTPRPTTRFMASRHDSGVAPADDGPGMRGGAGPPAEPSAGQEQPLPGVGGRAVPPPKFSKAILVAESGIRTHADVCRLARCGVGAVLVGESLIRQTDIPTHIQALLGGQAPRST
jgi:indole-3-glycerol phosphate synthase